VVILPLSTRLITPNLCFSLRQTREALLLSHAIEVIDEDEFLLLYDVNKSKNPGYPYWNYDAFDLDSTTDDECTSEFRFLKNDVYLLAKLWIFLMLSSDFNMLIH